MSASVKNVSAAIANARIVQENNLVSKEKVRGLKANNPHLVCVNNGAFVEYGYCSECGQEFEVDINKLPLSCPNCLCNFEHTNTYEYEGDLVDY